MLSRCVSCSLLLGVLVAGASAKQQVGATPAMGWNSWNKFGCNISEQLIMETADALVDSGLRDLGYVYLNLDDCWQVDRDPDTGVIIPDSKFPSGMKALGDYIHSKGLKYGIYSSAGTMTCAGRPASLGFEKIDAETYAEWGVDYLKYDNCYDDGVPTIPRFTAMSNALRATGRDIYYSICNWGLEKPATWAPAIGNSWRSTVDIFDTWDSIVFNFFWQEPFLRFSRPGSWNDPDMLEVGNGGLTTDQYRSHYSMWAVTKAPLLIGCDITDMDADTLDILSNREIIAISQDPLGLPALRRGDPLQTPLIIAISQDPLGLPALRRGDPLQTCGAAMHVFAGPLANGDVVVALFMPVPLNFCLPRPGALFTAEKIGFPSTAKLSVRDLWAHEELGVFTNEILITDVGAYRTTVLRITALDGSKHSLMEDYEFASEFPVHIS